MDPCLDQRNAIEHITKHVPKLITPAHNDGFRHPITQEEVDYEIKDMVARKGR